MINSATLEEEPKKASMGGTGRTEVTRSSTGIASDNSMKALNKEEQEIRAARNKETQPIIIDNSRVDKTTNVAAPRVDKVDDMGLNLAISGGFD